MGVREAVGGLALLQWNMCLHWLVLWRPAVGGCDCFPDFVAEEQHCVCCACDSHCPCLQPLALFFHRGFVLDLHSFFDSCGCITSFHSSGRRLLHQETFVRTSESQRDLGECWFVFLYLSKH